MVIEVIFLMHWVHFDCDKHMGTASMLPLYFIFYICFDVCIFESVSPWPNLRSNIDAIPLFEKSLTASDTFLNTARLVIPKKCAEVSPNAHLVFD